MKAGCATAAAGLARPTSTRILGRTLGLLMGVFGVAGCHGDLSDIAATARGDGGDDGTVAAQKPDFAVPVAVYYVSAIQNDLDSLGCTAGGSCHSGSAPMHVIAKTTDATLLAMSHAQVKMRASNDAMSLLLLKALAGSGTGHAGTQPLSSTTDPIYQRWLGWIRAGAPFTPPTIDRDGGTSVDGGT